jgi:hypothetical protein
MRPDTQLATILGLTYSGSTLKDSYLLINTAAAPGAGIVNTTIQYRGAADLYTLNGATSIATLYKGIGILKTFRHRTRRRLQVTMS